MVAGTVVGREAIVTAVGLADAVKTLVDAALVTRVAKAFAEEIKLAELIVLLLAVAKLSGLGSENERE